LALCIFCSYYSEYFLLYPSFPKLWSCAVEFAVLKIFDMIIDIILTTRRQMFSSLNCNLPPIKTKQTFS